MKNQKGITLIALVITIIVLLILAGVSISMVIGNNGILNQASTAKIESIGGSEKEQVELAFLSAKAKQLRGEFTVIDDEKLKTELTANGGMENVSTVEYDTTAKQLKVTFKSGNVFYLENDIVTWNREESGLPSTPNTPDTPATPDTDKVYLDSAQWDYTVENGEATITKYKVSGATTVTIPNYIRGEGDEADIPITKIKGTVGDGGMNNTISIWSDIDNESTYIKTQNTITELIISEGIKVIDEYAFIGTSNLVNITLPNSLTNIGEGAFRHCTSLTNVTISDNVQSIGVEAFYYCTNLTNVILPMSLTVIGDSAFSETNLSTIEYLGPRSSWNEVEIGNYNNFENVEIIVHSREEY